MISALGWERCPGFPVQPEGFLRHYVPYLSIFDDIVSPDTYLIGLSPTHQKENCPRIWSCSRNFQVRPKSTPACLISPMHVPGCSADFRPWDGRAEAPAGLSGLVIPWSSRIRLDSHLIRSPPAFSSSSSSLF
jgi:hypothetical protein